MEIGARCAKGVLVVGGRGGASDMASGETSRQDRPDIDDMETTHSSSGKKKQRTSGPSSVEEGFGGMPMQQQQRHSEGGAAAYVSPLPVRPSFPQGQPHLAARPASGPAMAGGSAGGAAGSGAMASSSSSSGQRPVEAVPGRGSDAASSRYGAIVPCPYVVRRSRYETHWSL